MIAKKHIFSVKNGKVEFIDRDSFLADMRRYEGKEACVVVKPLSEKQNRSLKQNAYYHGVVLKILSEELGYTGLEIHEVLKHQFLPTHDFFFKGEQYMIAPSTTDLNTAEFEEYLSHIRTWASSELGIFIPEPNEIEFDN